MTVTLPQVRAEATRIVQNLLRRLGIAGQDAALATDTIPTGAIIMWSGTLASIPSGWRLCDGTGGSPDLRGKFVKGTAVGVNPGSTGGAATHTPTGAVSQPTFTGNSNTTSSVSGGTPAGTVSQPTFTGNVNTTSQASAGAEPTGVVAGQLTLRTHTHTVTPTGTVSQPTFSGSALAGHQHTVTPTGTVTQPTFTGDSASYEPAFYEIAYIQKT